MKKRETLAHEIGHVLDVFKHRYAAICEDHLGLVAVSKKLSNGGRITIRYEEKPSRRSRGTRLGAKP